MIWLDMDGVLADFDGHYHKTFGYRPTRFPEPDNVEWKRIQGTTFYLDLPVMPGAYDLFRFADEAGLGVAILTGVPASIDAACNHKRDWAAQHFPDVQVVCCQSRDKWKHGKPDDFLIDDYLKYRVDWERMGGVFIHHTSAAKSIRELERCGVTRMS